jgi:selenophosphate synthetase-related protein
VPLYELSTSDQTDRFLWVTLYESTGFFLMTYAELEKIIQSMTKEEKSKKVVIGSLEELRLDIFHGNVADEVYFKDGDIYILY